MPSVDRTTARQLTLVDHPLVDLADALPPPGERCFLIATSWSYVICQAIGYTPLGTDHQPMNVIHYLPTVPTEVA